MLKAEKSTEYLNVEQMNTEKSIECLTVDQMMEVLQIGRTTAYRLLKANKIPHTKVGVQYRIPLKALEDLIYKKGDEHK